MRSLIWVLVLCFSSPVWASGPSERVDKAVADIMAIAKQQGISGAERRVKLQKAIAEHVDLQAAAQRVLAVYWRSASKAQKIEFMRVFHKVLSDNYASMLEKYENESVKLNKETVKNDKYATVETTVLSQGKEIPVNYQLMYRNGEWKIYDFVAEGISLVRSYSSDYQGTLKTEGVDGLNRALTRKLAETDP